MTTYAIIDFETTGISPDHGTCPTEVGIVLVQNGQITDRYQSLMNGGIRLSSFIEAYTGITNAMVRKAPPLKQVMAEACEFARDYPLVAHNAAFEAANHKLETLATFLKLPVAGNFHRALADAEVTAHLFVRMQEAIKDKLKLAEVNCKHLQVVERQKIGTF